MMSRRYDLLWVGFSDAQGYIIDEGVSSSGIGGIEALETEVGAWECSPVPLNKVLSFPV